jgi:hypothetical protein
MWARFQKAMHSLVWEGASVRPAKPATR